MLTDQNNQDPNRDQENENDSQSQNNNGNIGREAGDEQEGEGSFKNISTDQEKPVNEQGIGENQENHWSGNHGQKSSNRPGSHGQDSFTDRNLTDGVQQNSSRNHVTNAGGTLQEDLEKGKAGLKEEE